MEPRSSELMPRYGLRETKFWTPNQGFCHGTVPRFNQTDSATVDIVRLRRLLIAK